MLPFVHNDRPAAYGALLEVVAALRAVLGSLSAATVLHFYVRLPQVPLLQLLTALLPSAFQLGDCALLEDARDSVSVTVKLRVVFERGS